MLRLSDCTIDAEGWLVVSGEATSFSAYVATRHPGFTEAYPHAARADPLGLTAVVLTSDDQVIVTVRSLSADQNPGALYLVGGYAEPGDIPGTVDLFQDVAREIDEELAVGDLRRAASYAIGIAYDPVFCHPELFVLTVSGSTAADILSTSAGARDRDEAAQIFACALDAFLHADGPLADRPLTWSFVEARRFLNDHLARMSD
ncbi:NUDIX hydrolase [Rhizobium sp. PP-F2F-G48]|uniref:NUDIX hydrolase n=1 Tax=Rhizobium sp. PP-F2F-G48 TaxID=2135651 RepID=UPI001FDF14D3|nr:NUDIX hydrolase [Rhizobium sp. PP-F2F-G48]